MAVRVEGRPGELSRLPMRTKPVEGEECDISRQRRGGSLELKQLADRGAHIASNDPHSVSTCLPLNLEPPPSSPLWGARR